MENLYYYNPVNKDSHTEFCRNLENILAEYNASHREIVVICIGSDRATGDCLGPLVGEKLSKEGCVVSVYGTLASPVHAVNLLETLKKIREFHDNPLIIAVDASLGMRRHVGYVTLKKGSLRPGSGVSKTLPLIGDICITGIVGVSGLLNDVLLQTTRLHLVMQLSDFISSGIKEIS